MRSGSRLRTIRTAVPAKNRRKAGGSGRHKKRKSPAQSAHPVRSAGRSGQNPFLRTEALSFPLCIRKKVHSTPANGSRTMVRIHRTAPFSGHARCIHRERTIYRKGKDSHPYPPGSTILSDCVRKQKINCFWHFSPGDPTMPHPYRTDDSSSGCGKRVSARTVPGRSAAACPEKRPNTGLLPLFPRRTVGGRKQASGRNRKNDRGRKRRKLPAPRTYAVCERISRRY